MSTSSVSSARAQTVSPEAIAAWNDLTVSAADGHVRVLAIETGGTTAQRNASSGQPGQPSPMGPLPAAARPLLAANDAPIKHAEPSVVADAQAQRQPADDAAALLDFALGLCEQPENANPANAAPAPEAEKPDASTSLSLATQPEGDLHAGV